MTNRFQDDASLCFDDENNFLNHLNEVADLTEWQRKVPVDGFSFINQGNWLTLSFTEADFTGMPETEHMIELRETSKLSLFDRCKISGSALEDMPKDVLAHVLTAAASTQTGQCAAIAVVDGKVNAVVSDNGNGSSYAVMDSRRLFEDTQQYIWTTGASNDFHAKWKFDGWYAIWKLVKKAEFSGKQYDVAIQLSNSENGKGTVKLNLLLTAPGVVLPLPVYDGDVYRDDFTVTHRGDADENDLQEGLSIVDASIEESPRRLEELDSIQIENPVWTLNRIIDRFKFPKRTAADVINEYADQYAQELASARITTAADLYVECGRIAANYSGPNRPEVLKKVQKLVGIDWRKYDLNTPYYIHVGR